MLHTGLRKININIFLFPLPEGSKISLIKQKAKQISNTSSQKVRVAMGSLPWLLHESTGSCHLWKTCECLLYCSLLNQRDRGDPNRAPFALQSTLSPSRITSCLLSVRRLCFLNDTSFVCRTHSLRNCDGEWAWTILLMCSNSGKRVVLQPEYLLVSVNPRDLASIEHQF